MRPQKIAAHMDKLPELPQFLQFSPKQLLAFDATHY